MSARVRWAVGGLVLGAVLCMAFRHIERAAWQKKVDSLEARTVVHDSLQRIADDTVQAESLRKEAALAAVDSATARVVPAEKLRDARNKSAASDSTCAEAVQVATEPLLGQIDARDVVIERQDAAIQSYDRINATLTGQLVTERTLRYEWQALAKKAPVRGQRGIFAHARGFVVFGDSLDVGGAAGLTWRTGGVVHPYVEGEWRRGSGRELRAGGQVELRLF